MNDGLHILVLSKFNFEFGLNFWLVSSFCKLLCPFDWHLCGEYHCAGRRGLNLLIAVRPVELAHWILKTSKLSVTGFCAGISPATGEFPAQRTSIAKNVSIWWRHHVEACRSCRAFSSLINIHGLLYMCYIVQSKTNWCTLLFKSNGIFVLRWQNMVFISKVQTWNFVCCIRRSFAFTIEIILNVWYTATPGWTSKFGKVWKTRCQNAATRANIWRCFLVSWDDKYLWVMVSNNRHELYFCSKLLCFSSKHWFFWPNTVSKYQTWTNSYLIPSNA